MRTDQAVSDKFNPNYSEKKRQVVKRQKSGLTFNSVLIEYTGPAAWKASLHAGISEAEGSWVRPAKLTHLTSSVSKRVKRPAKTTGGVKAIASEKKG